MLTRSGEPQLYATLLPRHRAEVGLDAAPVTAALSQHRQPDLEEKGGNMEEDRKRGCK